jgi:hypothetical protein
MPRLRQWSAALRHLNEESPGLTIEEAADALGITMGTAKRDWTYARAWLFREIRTTRG